MSTALQQMVSEYEADDAADTAFATLLTSTTNSNLSATNPRPASVRIGLTETNLTVDSLKYSNNK